MCRVDVSLIRPKRLLEQIKGISEQKATKVLVEGKLIRAISLHWRPPV